MKIYIVFHTQCIDIQKIYYTIESVWETRAMARAASKFHAKESNISPSQYEIVEREINKLRKKL